MPCYRPLVAYHSKELNRSGKRSMVFNPKQALDQDNPVDLPCGQCVGCRLERSRQWAMRCLHEAQLHSENCFITLTFDQEHLQQRENPWSLDVTEFQRFMKRLRKHYAPRTIRFYHCGEYGEKHGRPHYHAILFGLDFEDRYHWATNNGFRYYRSDTLEKLWPYGNSMIGDVTFESAAYCARYIMKKITGEDSEEHYRVIEETTGELIDIKPEYTTMSRNPGIASHWFDKYHQDVYQKDYVTMRGQKMRAPKYYDGKMEQFDPLFMEDVKAARKEHAKQFGENNSLDRLAVRERVHNNRANFLKRNVDEET